jgi:hypothetical protein
MTPPAASPSQAALSSETEVPLSTVVRLAELSNERSQAVLQASDATLLRELQGVLDEIATARTAAGSPASPAQDLKRLPESARAGLQSIMADAASLTTLRAADFGSYRAAVESKATSIFKHCSYQELTVRRLATIADALRHVEERLQQIVASRLPGEPLRNSVGTDAGLGKQTIEDSQIGIVPAA